MKRTRIRDIRHEELIEATIKTVHRRGFSDATLSDIGAEIGAPASSISYYFGSKAHLLEATMQRLLQNLNAAMLEQYSAAETPKDRLLAVVLANFDDRIFRTETCNVWMQFWAAAPYHPALTRLHHINRKRVVSNFRAALRPMLPEQSRETARSAIQYYMDGVWVEAGQSRRQLDAETARTNAKAVVDLILATNISGDVA
ncbi:MAG: choline-binding transcriptional repressor BetI [Pikeienuella sp.]